MAALLSFKTMVPKKKEKGEVRVDVELENALDRELVVRGDLAPENLRSLETQLLVDTGAVMPVLPQDQVEALGLREMGKAS
jgi:hypothetical protein